MMRTANPIKMFSMTHSTWNIENRIQLLIDYGMLSRAAQTAFAGRMLCRPVLKLHNSHFKFGNSNLIILFVLHGLLWRAVGVEACEHVVINKTLLKFLL